MEETRATRKNRSYKLLSYDSNWKTIFQKKAVELEPIFGDNLIKIEHIGSTSVPGMVAKPQIDILIVVKDLGEVKSVYAGIQKLGYVPKGNFTGKNEEYFTLDDQNGQRLVSVHTMQEDNPEVAMYVLLRDYLRSDESARKRYTDKKLKLRDKYTENNYNSYDLGKSDLIEQLKQEAKEWALSSEN